MGKIFISYSWQDKAIADALDELFYGKGITLERDVRELRYRESIRAFMGRIRTADYCLMLIGDSFLGSANCMYEVMEFIKVESFRNRILQVIVGDVKIFSAKNRYEHVEYWQKRQAELDQRRQEFLSAQQRDIVTDLRMVENVQRNLPDFLSTIADIKLVRINNGVSAADFDDIYTIVDPEHRSAEDAPNLGGYLLANMPRTITENGGSIQSERWQFCVGLCRGEASKTLTSRWVRE